MTDDIKKLAADLVKSPHWRWIDGMKPNRQNNGRVGDSISRFPMCGWGDGDDDRIESHDIPDLDDPLTAAGLLLVAREAWADPNLYCCNLDGYDGCGWTTIIDRSDHPNSRHGVLWICGLTETEALARAILAAPTVTNKETP